jgi:hypothetical protein
MFLVGKLISKVEFNELYTLGSELGKGGFGTVYAGERKSDKVIKIFRIFVSNEIEKFFFRSYRLQ